MICSRVLCRVRCCPSNVNEHPFNARKIVAIGTRTRATARPAPRPRPVAGTHTLTIATSPICTDLAPRTSSMSGSATRPSDPRAPWGTARGAAAEPPPALHHRRQLLHVWHKHALEWLLAVVLGKTARSAPTDPPLDRRTGLGRVDATPGHYPFEATVHITLRARARASRSMSRWRSRR